MYYPLLKIVHQIESPMRCSSPGRLHAVMQEVIRHIVEWHARCLHAIWHVFRIYIEYDGLQLTLMTPKTRFGNYNHYVIITNMRSFIIMSFAFGSQQLSSRSLTT